MRGKGKLRVWPVYFDANYSRGEGRRVPRSKAVRDPAKADYNRRGVITKGTIIRTDKGLAKIVSRPGQDGALNAVVEEE